MNSFTEPNTITCETTEEWTQERKEAFDKASAYPHPSTTVISSLGQSVPISGVSGAVYAPMDTTPKQENQQLTHLFKQLQDTITAIIQLSTTSQQTQPDLKQAVETTLQHANWFYEMVGESINDQHDIEGYVNDRVDERVSEAVDHWFGYNFNINDYCDLNDIVADEIDSIVEDKLKDLLEEKLANANITINF